MEINAQKLNEANATVEAKIAKQDVEKKEEKIAKELAKTMNIPGFRKGKVPPAVIKKRYGDKLAQDAEAELVREALDQALEELGIEKDAMLGEPRFTKYEKGEEVIEMVLEIGVRPNIDITGYEEVIPEYEEPQVSDEEVEKRIEELADAMAQFKEVEEDRPAKEGDLVVIDFKGTLEDGSEIEGGSAQNFELRLGSGQFIPGFEEQVEGMKKGETKTIEVTFPEDYPNKELAGKKANFEVTLHTIKEKEKINIDDELAKKMLQKEDATLDELKEEVRKQLKSEKLSKLYNEELKPKLIEALVEKFEFDLPKNIVDQEIDVQLNNKAAQMSEEEIKELRENKEKLEELRKELEPEAQKSVKATFIVDALAKAEGINVADQEVVQTIYYEALQMGRNPQEILKAYEEQGLLPAIKMAMIEDRLLTHLLSKKNEKQEENA
ncbi:MULTISPECIES: trigger factor [unclassified Nitratiruptor]|uniref:trigger factor n=1 Tax=unclassified Nitratiruptor TaxID=2624044 RepID=UPI0019160913|nr:MULTISPECIES: trigger factor [unclassified Nitratiruptor]BCD59431.1 trigger factor [Nitratiruptor sp. YY08-10]BCD63355.1 trigger factor [Nitratiruptor sp. YY08-14]